MKLTIFPFPAEGEATAAAYELDVAHVVIAPEDSRPHHLHGAEAVCDVTGKVVLTLDTGQQLVRTWMDLEQGTELHEKLTKALMDAARAAAHRGTDT